MQGLKRSLQKMFDTADRCVAGHRRYKLVDFFEYEAAMNSSQNQQNFDTVPHSDLLQKVATLQETGCGEFHGCVWGYHRQFEFELTVGLS